MSVVVKLSFSSQLRFVIAGFAKLAYVGRITLPHLGERQEPCEAAQRGQRLPRDEQTRRDFVRRL